MRSERLAWSFGILSFVALVGCAGWLLFGPKSAPPDYGIIKPCKSDGHNGVDKPSVVYEVTIPDPFDFRYPNVAIHVYPLLVGEQMDKAHELSNKNSYTAPTQTRFDLYTNLKAAKQTAQVKIILADQSLSFLQGKSTVWDPEPRKGTGYSNMFCDLDTTHAADASNPYVTFTVHYPDDVGQNKTTHAHPNIGVIVKDSMNPTAYSLPIFIDPDVTNDG